MLIKKKFREKWKKNKWKIKEIFNKNLFEINFNYLDNLNLNKYKSLNINEKENLKSKLNQYFDYFLKEKNYEFCNIIIKFFEEIRWYLNENNLYNYIFNIFKTIITFGIKSLNLKYLESIFLNYKIIVFKILINEQLLNLFLNEICKSYLDEKYNIINIILQDNDLFMIDYDILFKYLNINNKYNFSYDFYIKILYNLIIKFSSKIYFLKYKNIWINLSYFMDNFSIINEKNILLYINLILVKNNLLIKFDYNIIYKTEKEYKIKLLEILNLQLKNTNNIDLIVNKKKFLEFLFNLDIFNFKEENVFIIIISIINMLIYSLDNYFIKLISNLDIFLKKLFSLYKINNYKINKLLNELSTILNSKNIFIFFNFNRIN